MQDSHPATCTVCCKRLIDADRKLPELLEESGYMLQQAVLYSLYLILAAIFSPLMIASWLFGSKKSARKLSAPLPVEARYHTLDAQFLTPSEKQVVHEQHAVLRALEHKIAYAKHPRDRDAFVRELAVQQKLHDDYANLLRSVSFDWQKRMDEVAKIEREMDTIISRNAGRDPDPSEMDRLLHLANRKAQVAWEASHI